LAVITFLPNGQYFIGIDPPATGFIEFGDFTWNQLTGALVLSPLTSTVPPGFPEPTFTGAVVTGGSIAFSSRAGSVLFASVAAVPEPGTYALLAGGLCLLGFMARTKRA
jgi:hypothetical protein